MNFRICHLDASLVMVFLKKIFFEEEKDRAMKKKKDARHTAPQWSVSRFRVGQRRQRRRAACDDIFSALAASARQDVTPLRWTVLYRRKFRDAATKEKQSRSSLRRRM